jgi:hypothetical protein
MPSLPAICRSLPTAVALASALLVFAPMLGAEAQQRPKAQAQQAPRDTGEVGFYSLRLSDIWGPAKMPPAPKDFGPHFDFPPEPLNGAPLHDPYPN